MTNVLENINKGVYVVTPCVPRKGMTLEVRMELRKESERLRMNFKNDALTELGIAGHPKADRAFEMAWDDAHSHGLTDVYHKLEELSELLK